MKILLYSAVDDENLFTRVGFYRDDICALKMRGDNVIAVNSLLKIFKFNPDFVVCYFYSKSFLAGLVGRIIGAKVVFTGGADQICPALVEGYTLKLRKALAFLCLIIAHKIFVSCTEDFNNFRLLALGFPCLTRKIALVPHAVIPSHFHGTKARSNNVFDAFTIAWMGSIGNVRRKGVDRAISLISILRRRGINATLKIAGTPGPGLGYLLNLVENFNLTEHVFFLGAITENHKNQIYSTADVYLQLSEHEGFGVAAAEAFFSGMTVVHSNVGGLRDVIGNQGLILSLSAIEGGDDEAINEFYDEYLKYMPDEAYLLSELNNYSLRARSNAFLGVENV